MPFSLSALLLLLLLPLPLHFLSRFSTCTLHRRIKCIITNQSPKNVRVVIEMLSVCMKEGIHDGIVAITCCSAQSGTPVVVPDIWVGSIGEEEIDDMEIVILGRPSESGTSIVCLDIRIGPVGNQQTSDRHVAIQCDTH